VQESGKTWWRGGRAGSQDVIKAYYDKKNKKTQGQYTTENKSEPPGKGSPAAAIAPRAAAKPRGQRRRNAGSRPRGAAALKDFMVLSENRRGSRLWALTTGPFSLFNFPRWAFGAH